LTHPNTSTFRAGALAAALGFLAVAGGAGPWAQTAQAQAEQRYTIPAGPLEDALNSLARQAGVTLSFDPELVSGLRTAGLSGEHTLRDALDRLLSGTDVRYRVADGGTVTLEAAGGSGQGEPGRLAPITVEGSGAATDVTLDTGYVPERSVTATKTNAPILDTPASVSVVNKQVIEDQGARDLDEALRNVTSIGRIANEGNVGGQNDVTVRGFQTNRIFKNGFRFDNATGSLDLANVSRVEVLKGPASIIFGAIEPGGLVNIITKRPQPETGVHAAAEADEFGRASVELDLTGSLTADGSLMHRTVLSHDEGDVFIDNNEVEDTLISHSLTWLPTDRLSLDFHAEYVRDDGTFQFGIPFRGNEPDRRIPVEQFLGESFNEKENEDVFLQTRGSYLIGEASELRWQAGYHHHELNAVALRPFGGNNDVQPDDTIGRGFSLRENDTTSELQLDLDFLTEQRFLGRDHEILASIQYHDFDSDGGAPSGNNADAPPVNVLDPQLGQVSAESLIRSPDFAAFAPDAGNDNEQLHLVLQDSVWATPRLKILAGLAYTDIEQSTLFPSFGLDRTNTGDDLLPRAGGLYKITPGLSAYASYAESLNPNFGGNPDGQQFDPSEGEQFEIGLKHTWDAGGFVSLALYELTQTNIPEPIGDGSGFSRLIGEIRNRGVEVELAADLPLGLRLEGGYSYIDSDIRTEDNPNRGNSNPNVPEHRASLWLTGDVIDTGTRRLELGGGIFWEDERFVTSANDKRLPSYSTVDLMAAHEWKLSGGSKLRLQLNLLNVFDERFFESGFANAAQPGQPRTLLGTLKWTL